MQETTDPDLIRLANEWSAAVNCEDTETADAAARQLVPLLISYYARTPALAVHVGSWMYYVELTDGVNQLIRNPA